MTDQTVALLGDSILDNWPYTRPEPDTTAHLQRLLGPGPPVVRLARDGATMGDMRLQLRELEGRPAHAIVSIGGNDATEHIGLLDRRATGAGEVLEDLLRIADDFQRRYEATVTTVAERADHIVLCTIYEVQLEPAVFARLARVPLAVLNDRIVRTAARLGLDVLELRSVCTEPADFVRQIEPSPRGAVKIAEAIAAVLRGDARLRYGRVFAA
jgi:lysophospholipase L1-like esterase